MHVRAVLLTGMLALAVPVATAQEHAHDGGSGIRIAHDLNADGYTVVGALNHFDVIAFGGDTKPDFHQDLPVRILLNHEVVFQTTDVSGHDYDGVVSIDIAFWETGTFAVEALLPDGSVADRFAGTVAPLGASSSMAETQWQSSLAVGSMGGAIETTVDGQEIHSDALWQVLEEGRVVMATKTHSHAGPQGIEVAPTGLGPFTLWVETYQAYPRPNSTIALPLLAPPFSVPDSLVPARAGALPLGTTPPRDAAPVEANAVVESGATDAYRMVGTYDPWTRVGPDTLQSLAVLVIDPATGLPVQHVDFTASLVDGLGRVLFASDTLHEYDGILEFASRQPVPGLYVFAAEASYDGWTGSLRMPYVVAPPVEALSAGPIAYELEMPDEVKAGEPTDFTLVATDGAGMPFGHTDAILEVLGGPAEEAVGSTVLVRTKIHTHDDGRTPFTLAFPQQGTYALRVTPSPLEPRPVLFEDGYQFQVNVARGDTSATGDTPEVQEEESPAAGLAALTALALLAALVVRRRR